MNNKPEIFYPFNDTFGNYGPPRAGIERAQAFCDAENECFGGHWVVHTKAQHDKWWNATGREHFEAEVRRLT